MTHKGPVGLAVIGAGYWGINHVRVFSSETGARLLYICDLRPECRLRAQGLAPAAKTLTSFQDVLAADEVDAVVLATPSATHVDLACRALRAGKHVLVEKPLALDVAGAERVRHAAQEAGRILMVGHLMVYHPAVQRIRDLLHTGELGELYYLYSTRVNLGRLRRDENALWSFAPHDLSMMDFLLGERPLSVTARGEAYLQPGIQDVVFLTLRFRGRQMAHIHLSWLDPHKERRLTVVGSKKMLVFDDVATDKVRIYDKGYDRPPTFTNFDEFLSIRHGDIHIPHMPMMEPLRVECRHFLECIHKDAPPRTGVEAGVRVVQILAAAQASLERDGEPMSVDEFSEIHSQR